MAAGIAHPGTAAATTGPRLLVVVGPTASGKTALGVQLARRLGGEVLSADSMQVYRGLDIGTAKPTASERQGVPHHLLDLVSPDDASMSAARWAALADQVVADLGRRGKTPIVVGGTGLYLRALLRGLFPGPPADPGLRAELAAEADRQGSACLHARLATVDPVSAARIHPGDRVRIVRALEVHALTAVPMSTHQQAHAFARSRYPALLLGLAPPRAELHRRIDARLEQMIAAGLLDEVRRLRDAGYGLHLPAMRALGYPHLLQHLGGTLSLDQALERTRRDTRRYARRQLTWFRAEPDIRWLPEGSALPWAEIEAQFRLAPPPPLP